MSILHKMLTADVCHIVRVQDRLWLVDGAGRAWWPVPARWPRPVHVPVPVVSAEGGALYRAQTQQAFDVEKVSARVVGSVVARKLKPEHKIRPAKKQIHFVTRGPAEGIHGEIWYGREGLRLMIRQGYCEGLRLLARKAKTAGSSVLLGQLPVGAVRSRYSEPEYQPVVLVVDGQVRAAVMPMRWKADERADSPSTEKGYGDAPITTPS